MIHCRCRGNQNHWCQRIGSWAGDLDCWTPPHPHPRPSRATRNLRDQHSPSHCPGKDLVWLCLRATRYQANAEAGSEPVSVEPQEGRIEDKVREETAKQASPWGTLIWGPFNRSISGTGQPPWAKILKGKLRTKGIMGKGMQEVIILGVLPWQPASSNL